MNVGEVVETIIKACETPRMVDTGDRLIAGEWGREVTGIVSTFMATIGVIQDAIARGANLILTHEPTFYTDWDQTDWLAADDVFLRKQKLIEEHQINIWRFHDYMHASQPDKIFDGLNKHLNWGAYAIKDQLFCYRIPPTTLGEVSDYLKEKLEVKTARIIGDNSANIERVGLLIGAASLGLGDERMPMNLINAQGLDLVVCGEILEWTSCAYVRDAYQIGLNKSMLVLGHNRTEEIGMQYLVGWLEGLFPAIPVHFSEAGEPFRPFPSPGGG